MMEIFHVEKKGVALSGCKGVVSYCGNKTDSQGTELQSYTAAASSHPSLHLIIKQFFRWWEELKQWLSAS